MKVDILLISATRLDLAAFKTQTPLGRSLTRNAPLLDTPSLKLQAHITANNSSGLPTIYNRAIIEENRGKILLFIHDDVWLDDIFFAQRIIEGLDHFDVIGVAGNIRRLPGQLSWLQLKIKDTQFVKDDPSQCSGAVAHGTTPCGAISYYGTSGQACKLLDGVLLATYADSLLDADIRFDPQFDFHFYDMDFCRAVEQKKRTMGSWPIALTHVSGGGIDQRWIDNLQRYQTKWSEPQDTLAITALKNALRDNTPQDVETLGKLGATCRSQGKYQEAETYYRQGLAAAQKTQQAPEIQAALHYNLGNLLRVQKQHAEAQMQYEHALRLNPTLGQAQHNIGLCLRDLGQLEQAAAAFIKAAQQAEKPIIPLRMAFIALSKAPSASNITPQAESFYLEAMQRYSADPDLPDLAVEYAKLLQERGEARKAVLVCQQAFSNGLSSPALLDAMAVCLSLIGETKQAEHYFVLAIKADPQRGDGYANYGHLLRTLTRYDEAIRLLELGLQKQPKSLIILSHLADVMTTVYRLSDAERYCQQAIAINPAHGPAYLSLGGVYHAQGRFEKAAAFYRQAERLSPDDDTVHSNLLFSALYHDQYPPEKLSAEHLAYGKMLSQRYAAAHQPIWSNTRDPQKCLRIGFVSPDLYRHPIGLLLASWLGELNPQAFQIYVYTYGGKTDEITASIQKHSHAWRDISQLSNEEAAQLIRADQIDVLFELSGYTSAHKMKLFALKPAPVQLSWAGYVFTTGLPEIDYNIQDSYTALPKNDKYYSEKILRLPGSVYCYTPPETPPDILDTPGLKNGYITFGCFNHVPKLTATTIDLWASALKAVPNARLLLKAGPFSDDSTRARYAKQISERGIDPSRLTFIHPSEYQDYLNDYGRVDIALDPTPFNGGMTSLQGLWQGVPLITLEGQSHHSRVGGSLMHALGLDKWIARNPKDFAKIAQKMAADLSQLNTLRHSMRDRLRACSVGNPKQFAQEMESLLRQAWQNTACQGTACQKNS